MTTDSELRALCERALNETALTLTDTLRKIGYPTVAEVVTIRIAEAKILARDLLARLDQPQAGWQPIHTIPSCDDVMWFCRGNVFEGPRAQHGDEADYWDWWCYAVPPALPAAPKDGEVR